MTELEKAYQVSNKIKELEGRIKAASDMRDYAIKHKDEIDKQIWARQLRELRQEKHTLHESIRYVELTTFCEVIKTYLTKEQYHEVWRKVDQIIENPYLMQK